MQDYVKNNPVILGLRRIRDLTPEQVADLIEGALAKGIHYFDIADIYSGGQCESNLGAALKLKPYLREKRFIQTKCGIVRKPGEGTVRDLSKEHILEAVDASLNRRGLTYVDSLLLHRPDVFRNNKEIHAAFKQLYEEGKVKHFGVSNRDTEIIDYLKDGSPVPIEFNQIQVSLGQPAILSQIFNTNNPDQTPLLSDHLFFYRKHHNRALQCWSPYQYGFFNGSIFTNKHRKPTQDILSRLAEKYHTSPCAIATAFLSRLGDNVQVVTGSVSLDHIQQTIDGTKIKLTRAEWYELYCSTGSILP